MFDERTILAMMTILPLALAGVSAALRYGLADDVRGIGGWAWVLLLFGLSASVVVAWPTDITTVPLLIANALFVPASTLIGFSVSRYFRQSVRPWRWVLSALLVYAFSVSQSFDPAQGRLRVVVLSIYGFSSAAIGAAATVKSGELGRGIGAKILLGALGVLMVGALLRALAAVTNSIGPVTLYAETPGAIMVAFLTLLHLGLLLGTLGLLRRSGERMRVRLEHLAAHDPLTGVLTRGGFAPVVTHALARAVRQNEPIALVLIDVDHFKQVNDRYGHQAGDEVLCNVASVLGQHRRAGDLVARLGGEEFALLLPHCDGNAAQKLAESVRSALAEHSLDYLGQRIAVTGGFGVAACPPCAPEFNELYRCADEALYRAKCGGRNHVDSGPLAATTPVSD